MGLLLLLIHESTLLSIKCERCILKKFVKYKKCQINHQVKLLNYSYNQFNVNDCIEDKNVAFEFVIQDVGRLPCWIVTALGVLNDDGMTMSFIYLTISNCKNPLG